MSERVAWVRIKTLTPWLGTYLWQQVFRHLPDIRPLHFLIGIADHFEPMNRSEPSAGPVDRREQERRVKAWCDKYPSAMSGWRDQEGLPLRHTYFYPAEDYDKALVGRLAEHCQSGWGEIEIHLHHGVENPDTETNTGRTIIEFRDFLAASGCLSREQGTGAPRYGFVHGNWALANSDHGRFCGVNNEMQILADTGCYADFTLPSAPSSAQISKINSVYECSLPLTERAPHRRGCDLKSGQKPRVFPLIIQGPLMLNFDRGGRKMQFIRLENGELSGINPPTLRRLRLWKSAAISVKGRPDWLFIKLHCHGLQVTDEPAMFGALIQRFLRELQTEPGNGSEYQIHFVTMREMVNIALAACDGRQGNPATFRDYVFQLTKTPVRI